MKYIINRVLDFEETVITEFRKHLYNDVRFREIFPNFGNVRVSGVHPFVYLLESQINENVVVPTGLFPSITMVMESDRKDSELNVATLKKDITISSSEVADIAEKRYLYIISDKDLQELQELTAEGGLLYASGAVQRRTAHVVAEVWSENVLAKNRLYDICNNYFVGEGRFSLNEDYDIIIKEDSVDGQKSGNYNYDFGYTLYGGIIRLEAAFIVSQYVIDMDNQVVGAEVEVDVNPE